MKSSDLPKIKRVNTNKQKRVMFINPKKKNTTFSNPHNGLAILAAILKNRGHEVLIIDYLAMRRIENTEISFFVNQFRPDIVGISSYTPNAKEVNETISEIREMDANIPIMLGGPHATLYSEDVQKDNRVDYIFIGEAELTIIGVVENAKREKKPKIIRAAEIVNLDNLPLPDYTAFYDYKSIRGYGIMTSRGCPNQCSFCAAFGLAYRRWRLRKIEDCIKELEIAKKTISPHLYIGVNDDCPTAHKERFNEFLRQYYEKIRLPLFVTNTRADSITDEFIKLLKKCGCKSIAIGVEHAHPEVFKLINKGETLEDIENACKLIKKYNFGLFLTFIIGLPEDTLERTKASIEFYKRVKADSVSLNLITPFKGTAVRKWFEEHDATLYDEVGSAGQIPKSFECPEPIVETLDFSKEDRKKAYYMFLFGAAHEKLKLRKMLRILKVVRRYGLYYEFLSWLPNGIVKSLKNKNVLMKSALNIYRNEGLQPLVARYKLRNKEL